MDGELLQLLRIPFGIPPRLGARFGGHLGDAKAHRTVAKGGRLAGGEGQIQRGREEAPGADKLGQLAIRHDHCRFQSAGAGAQAREGERVAALPVVALKPAQMLGDKVAVGAPVRGEADERPQSDFVDTGTAKAVWRGEAPRDVPLVAAQMMAGVGGGVVGLLIDHDGVEAEALQLGIFGLREGLHLHPHRAEVAADDGHHLAKIGEPHLVLMLAGNQQHAVKTARLDGQTLALYLLCIQGLALEAVAHGEAAVGAVVGAEVRQIERYIEADGVAKTLAGQALGLGCHLRQVRLGGWRDQRHKIGQGAAGCA